MCIQSLRSEGNCFKSFGHNLNIFQPHFPGYPIYIAFAKFFVWLGASKVMALSLVNALSATVLFWSVHKHTKLEPLKLLPVMLCIPLLFDKGLIHGFDLWVELFDILTGQSKLSSQK